MKQLLLLATIAMLLLTGCATDALATVKVKIQTDVTEYIADVISERIDSNEKLSDVQKAGMKETISNLEAEILAKINQIDEITKED